MWLLLHHVIKLFISQYMYYCLDSQKWLERHLWNLHFTCSIHMSPNAVCLWFMYSLTHYPGFWFYFQNSPNTYLLHKQTNKNRQHRHKNIITGQILKTAMWCESKVTGFQHLEKEKKKKKRSVKKSQRITQNSDIRAGIKGEASFVSFSLHPALTN